MDNTDKIPQPVTQDALTPCLTRSAISHLIHGVSDEKVKADFDPIIRRLESADTEDESEENVEKNKQIQKDYFDLLFRYATDTLKGSSVNAHSINQKWFTILGNSTTTISRMMSDPSFMVLFASINRHERVFGRPSGISSLHLKTALFVWVFICWTAAYNSLHHLGVDDMEDAKKIGPAFDLNVSTLQSNLSAGVQVWSELSLEILDKERNRTSNEAN